MTMTDTPITTTTVGIRPGEFVRCVSNTALFAAPPEGPVLACVRIEVAADESVARFVATDSYGLVLQPVEMVEKAQTSATALVNAKELLAVAKDVKAAKVRDVIALTFGDGTLTITYGIDTYRRVLRCHDGTFPSYERLIPHGWENWTGSEFALGVKALTRIGKIDGQGEESALGQTVKFRSTDPEKPVVITIGDTWVLHMPVRREVGS